MDRIGLKHLLAYSLIRVRRFFYIHRHRYVLYAQPEIKIHGYTQAATLDKEEQYIYCEKCGKGVEFRLYTPHQKIQVATPIND